MHYNRSLLSMIFVVILFSCRKEHIADPIQPPTMPSNEPARHVLLKDIILSHSPSPFYHFEYNADSLVAKADFASGFTMYDIIYDGNKISEMRDNIFVNHDTLRYFYDTGNKVAVIDFINEANVIYRHATFTYSGDLVKEIWWDHKNQNGDFPIDRILTFSYYPDGNVRSIREQRRSNVSSPWVLYTKTFEQYDKQINVDDFSLIHDGIHDHLFLLQGFRLQKNNPAKEIFLVDGVEYYTVNYTYVYNNDHTPSTKTGDLLYKSGPDAGKNIVINSVYTYY
jgi:hypothetical protein